MNLKLRSEGRQSILVGRAEFTHEDLADGNFVDALQLPSDAVILRGYLAIIDPFDGATTISLGTAATPDKYLGATAAGAAGITPLSGGINGDVVGDVTMAGVNPSAAMTQGKGVFLVEYIRRNRSFSTEG